MVKKFSKISRIVSFLIVFSLLFVTITEGYAVTSESVNEEACEEQAQIIENVVSDNLVNDDVYETDDTVVADGYSSTISIPKKGDSTIVLDDGEGESIEFGLPEESNESNGVLTDNGTVIYDCNEDVSIGVQPLTEQIGDEEIDSVRALITILNADAPHEYSFEFKLQGGERLVTAKEYLGPDYDTGEVYILNTEDELQSVIDPAWAKDANGNPVNTHYEVRGNSIVQIVDFDENTASPVVADPSVWQITKCVGAISCVVVSTAFAVAKVVKIKKYIKALGGIKKSASKLIGIIKNMKAIAKKYKISYVTILTKAKYSRELWKGVGNALMNFGAEILGIDNVITNCSF